MDKEKEPATPAETASVVDDDSVSLEEYLRRLPRIRRGDIKTLKALREKPQEVDHDC